jgi:hypothetical protein
MVVRTSARGVRCLLAIVVIAFVAGCSPRQQPVAVGPRVGSIDGRVVNETGYRVQTAGVSVTGTAVAAESDWNGYFTLTDVPAGPVRLSVSKSGFEDGMCDAVVVGGQSTAVKCKLRFDIPADDTPYLVVIRNSSTYNLTSPGPLRPGESTTRYYPPGRHSIYMAVAGFGLTKRTIVVYKNPTYVYFVYNDGVYGFETR